MNKSMTLTLGEEDLKELRRIMLNEDREAALKFLRVHVDKKVNGGGAQLGH